jgi:phospholipid/cholesterol/gamma-HCH transport system substrate-binding protein
MLNSLKGAKLGIFIFLGTLLFVVIIFVIGNKNSLFTDTTTVISYFSNIGGLKNGSPVNMSGYQVGFVNRVSLIPDSLGKVEVDMKINNDVISFVRIDSKASIETKGVIGQKYVAITPGSNDLPVVKEGTIIASESPVNITDMINNTNEIMSYTKNMMQEFNTVLEKINNGEGTIGKLVNDDELYTSTVHIVKTADTSLATMTLDLDNVAALIDKMGENLNSILKSVDSTTQQVGYMIKDIRNGKGALGVLVGDRATEDSLRSMVKQLSSTVNEIKIGSIRFSEDMEALKHNWLFKSYFEERGYWDYGEFKKEIKVKMDELNKRIEELKKLENKHGIKSED